MADLGDICDTLAEDSQQDAIDAAQEAGADCAVVTWEGRSYTCRTKKAVR